MENNGENVNMPESTSQNEIKCFNCGAHLTFAPGTTSLKCEYCGALNEIKIDESALEDAVKEIDYLSTLEDIENLGSDQLEEVHTVKCAACGAETTFNPNVVSSLCDFCGSPIAVKSNSTAKIIKPKAILPFKLEQYHGSQLYKQWLKGLWFAPNDLKKLATQSEKLSGVYLPYWTYDAVTDTFYTGERGDDYKVPYEYKDKDGNVKTGYKTQTRWSAARGRVHNEFDDIFVVGSKSLPRSYLDGLEPWNLQELVPYDEKFLSGFKTETYGVDLKAGFETAQQKMQPKIDSTIRNDIGGDRQKIDTKNVNYSDITFKHILLPVWISAYRYKDKVYRFVINGQSGRVQGERPVSWIKVIALIVAIVAIISLFFIFSEK